jgi:hypothetical protein
MTQALPPLLFERRAASQFIAQADLRLRGAAFDELAEDRLREWVRVLEVSLLFATIDEAALRLGLQTAVDVVREIERLDSFVVNVSRLDIARVCEENQAFLEPFIRLQPHAQAPMSIDINRTLLTVQSLLLHCPIGALEQAGHKYGCAELAHRCRLAFDGLTSFVARNSHPQQQAITAAGQAYAEGRLSLAEVAAVLALPVPDAVALLEEHGFRRCADQLLLSDDARRAKLAAIRSDRVARDGVLPDRPDLVAREVVASQRIEDIDARPWLRS